MVLPILLGAPHKAKLEEDEEEGKVEEMKEKGSGEGEKCID